MTRRRIHAAARTELVQRHPDAWWSWDNPTDRPDLRRRPAGDVTALVGHWTAAALRGGHGVLTIAIWRMYLSGTMRRQPSAQSTVTLPRPCV